ncbi:MAG: HAD family hydrolase, partial [Legionella sp.]
MTQHIIYKDTFLISGIMCYQGCGKTIQAITSDLQAFKDQKILPNDANLIIDAEPQSFGVHKLIVTVQSDSVDFKTNGLKTRKLFKEQIESAAFTIIDESNDEPHKKRNWENAVNILINLSSMAIILTLSMIFPPSILLTTGLGVLSFATSGFTSRSYLMSFFNNLRTQDLGNMSSAVALGWFLALAHALYHSIAMPLSTSFSMMFMSFIMPIMLITIINGMDELKRLIMNKSKKMQLHGIHSLFPQMTDKYLVHDLSLEHQEQLTQIIENRKENPCDSSPVERLLQQSPLVLKRKNSLSKGQFIQVKSGECFPVDCIVIHGNTLVDSSLLTGELLQEKQISDFIPAGSINLGQTISVCVIENSYNSTINRLLFKSNRAQESQAAQTNQQFTYYYGALIALGITAAVLIPLILGVLTIPLFLQNVTGILFAVCPCTIGISHELPHILSLYYRNIQGIRLTNEDLLNHKSKIHTVVFDKTGTLTTGSSEIDSYEGISPAVWQRIYLLERNYGAEHPLAKALCNYYEEYFSSPCIDDLRDGQRDLKNRGISGIVQGKKILLGNAAYLTDSGIQIPVHQSAQIAEKLALGYSAVYVAEDQQYMGVILIKHQIRPHILPALQRLKQEGIKIILLTGDQIASAQGFNQQHGNIFA